MSLSEPVPHKIWNISVLIPHATAREVENGNDYGELSAYTDLASNFFGTLLLFCNLSASLIVLFLLKFSPFMRFFVTEEMCVFVLMQV